MKKSLNTFSSRKKHVRWQVVVLLLVASLITTPHVDGYKILVSCIPAKSHSIVMGAIARELAHRGHDVHFMIGAKFWIPPNVAGVKNITIERFGSADFEAVEYETMVNDMVEEVLAKNGDYSDFQVLMDQFLADDSRQLLANSEEMFKKFEEIKFDIALVDGMFILNYIYLVPHRLRVPWITVSFFLSPFDMPSPILPSFVPSKLSTYTDVMTFSERIINIFYTLVPIINKGRDPAEEIVQRYRKFGEFQTSHDLVSKSKLFITMRDILLDYPMPTMPNMIHAGGISVQPVSGKPFNEDMEKFMSGAKNGVILMTFGTLATYFPQPLADKYIAVFRQLGNNYRILWKFDNRDNLTISENVMISKWLPQNDLLGDNRVKLFITHCGNNGQFESLYHAKPMIGFPIFVDQGYNCRRMEAKGYGFAMNIHEFQPDQLLTNIKRILTESKFRYNIAKASEIYRSTKETPAERASDWIEHILKFGADHLQASGKNLNVFQYLMLDIAGLVLLCIVIIMSIFIFLARMMVRKCFCSNSPIESYGSRKTNGKKIN